MQRLCVFCGSSPGANPEYMLAAKGMGQALAARKITLVYGGGKVGLMGQVAKTCLEAGGEVIGVIPRKMVEMELAYREVSQLHVVNSMHERKALMADLSDGFIGLPGGLGTLEEFFEVATWAQLGLHPKPCGFLNTCGYYNKLIEFLDHMRDQQFVDLAHRQMIQLDGDPEALLKKFEAYQAPTANKAAWVLELTKALDGTTPTVVD